MALGHCGILYGPRFPTLWGPASPASPFTDGKTQALSPRAVPGGEAGQSGSKCLLRSPSVCPGPQAETSPHQHPRGRRRRRSHCTEEGTAAWRGSAHSWQAAEPEEDPEA